MVSEDSTSDVVVSLLMNIYSITSTPFALAFDGVRRFDLQCGLVLVNECLLHREDAPASGADCNMPIVIASNSIYIGLRRGVNIETIVESSGGVLFFVVFEWAICKNPGLFSARSLVWLSTSKGVCY